MPHLMEEDADAAAPSGSSSSSSMSLLLLPGMSTTATTASTASNELKIDFNQQEQEEEQEDELRRGPPTADTPGGDCKSLCIRHQRMANGPANLVLQQVRYLSHPAFFVPSLACLLRRWFSDGRMLTALL